jgi:hypothetical protein
VLISQGSYVAVIDAKELKCKDVEYTQVACQVLFKPINLLKLYQGECICTDVIL